jgi:hypothetical protein
MNCIVIVMEANERMIMYDECDMTVKASVMLSKSFVSNA